MLDQKISIDIKNEEILHIDTKETESDDDSLFCFEDEKENSSNNLGWSDGGEVVAACIIAAANLIENRLANSVEQVTKKLEMKSQKVINSSPMKSKKGQVVQVDTTIEALLTDDAVELYDNSIKRKGVQLVNYTDKARKASEKLKENTKNLTTGIRGTTTEAVIMISERADEVDLAGKLCPSAEGKEAFYATGKVAMSGLGAASRLLDALYLSTKEVAKKGVEVSADVARHRYGDDAGKLVENTGHAVGNTLRTLHLISQLHGSNFAKTIGRDTGKAKLNRKQSSGSDNNLKDMSSTASHSTRSTRSTANGTTSENSFRRRESSKKSIELGKSSNEKISSMDSSKDKSFDSSRQSRSSRTKDKLNRSTRSIDFPSDRSFNSRPTSERRTSSMRENGHKRKEKRKTQTIDI